MEKKRQIEFRVWNGSEMEYSVMSGYLGTFYVAGTDEKDKATMSPFNTIYPNSIDTMQFTGMYDKNGGIIYEGDIVKCGYGKGKVVFKSGCFMVEWIDDKEAYMEFLFSRKGMYVRKDDELFEVIGNIYEHKHLL